MWILSTCQTRRDAQGWRKLTLTVYGLLNATGPAWLPHSRTAPLQTSCRRSGADTCPSLGLPWWSLRKTRWHVIRMRSPTDVFKYRSYLRNYHQHQRCQNPLPLLLPRHPSQIHLTSQEPRHHLLRSHRRRRRLLLRPHHLHRRPTWAHRFLTYQHGLLQNNPHSAMDLLTPGSSHSVACFRTTTISFCSCLHLVRLSESD